MTQQKGAPAGVFASQPSAHVQKTGSGEGDVSAARVRVSVNDFSGRSQARAGRTAWGPAHPQVSGRIRQRLSRKRLSRSRAAPQGDWSPENKLGRPLRGRDSGFRPWNGLMPLLTP